MNGRSQAVRMPKDFRFEGDEVFIKKVGSPSMFSEDFMEEYEQPQLQGREDVFP